MQRALGAGGGPAPPATVAAALRGPCLGCPVGRAARPLVTSQRVRTLRGGEKPPVGPASGAAGETPPAAVGRHRVATLPAAAPGGSAAPPSASGQAHTPRPRGVTRPSPHFLLPDSFRVD